MLATVNALDRRIISIVTRLPAGLRPLMELASLGGQPVCMMALAVAAIWCRHDWLPYGVGLAIVIGVSSTLKLVLRRTRPDTYIHKLYRTYSFPSGHAVSTSVTLGLGAVLAPAILNPGGAVLFGVVAACMVGLIGLSRIFLGAHYPSDVLGGWGIGLISLLCITNLIQP